MAIVPSGSRRVMIAQSFGKDLPNVDFGENNPSQPNETVPNQNTSPTPSVDGGDPSIAPKGTLPGGIGEDSSQKEIEEGGFGKIPEEKSDTASDLTEFIFNKLEAFGYPPRRLEQFEDEFVHEKIFPGGVREVTVVIPDRYYATRKRLSDKDFGTTIKEIQSQFGLSFVDAERKDKRISINFTSQKPQVAEGEEEMVGDDLDDVYGGGGSSGKGGKEKQPSAPKQPKPAPQKIKAATMGDMIKTSRNNLVDILLKQRENQ